MAWRLKDVAEPTLEQLKQILPQDIAPDPEPRPSSLAETAAAGSTDTGTTPPDDQGS